MVIKDELLKRSDTKCELCSAENDLEVYQIPPDAKGTVDDSILICSVCKEQIEDPEKMDTNHWRCLNDSMWSEVPGVQVVAWRMLNRLKNEGWPQGLLDMLYLDEETQKWSEATGEGHEESEKIIHKDVNGVVLQAGDSVVLIKDLKVKGSSMVAKQGTAVRRISLDSDNAEYIEGKVDGQHIVIITKYVKKIG
jgi:protein PhnA